VTTGFVVQLADDHSGYCVESFRGFTYCGERFDPTAVEREVYAVGRESGHPHDTLCFDCATVDSHALRGAAREVLADA
jgi:hypothetical protein